MSIHLGHGGSSEPDAKETIDHERRVGKSYGEKPLFPSEVRHLLSEKMKEFNRKTGKLTAMGNRNSRRRKKRM